MKKILVLLVVLLSLLAFMGCESDAVVASRNVSQLADNFGIYRRAVFYNGITNEYILDSGIFVDRRPGQSARGDYQRR